MKNLKSNKKIGKRHEKQNLLRKVAPTMLKVPICLGNAIAPILNVKNEL